MRSKRSPSALGKEAERKAEKHLRSKGYLLVSKNTQTPLGEIDLIMKQGDSIVLVEVKGGQAHHGFSPLDHFNREKKDRLLRAGQFYLASLKRATNARFDLVAVTEMGDETAIDHYENVIEDPGS